MSYTVLARRYRSATFDEVVGQNHIAQTLKKAIATGRIAHAFLFCGTRGTGKTSMARILAKALNCLAFDAPTTNPCLKCSSCLSIARGDDIDVIEIDAASNTGVDDVRDTIIHSANNVPARSRFKVFVIDEVHMLSRNAFNALLKTVEEPPPHVKFILATTEPEKVPATILSRCQRYDFRNIPTREIATHLRGIVISEKIEAADDALLMIAKAGAGSMRDSLSLLDRVLSIGERELTADTIEQLLGLPKVELTFNLANALADGDARAVLEQAESIISGGMAADSLLTSLSDYLRNLLIILTCGRDSGLVEIPGLSPDAIAAQAQRFDAIILSQNIAIVEELRRQLRGSHAGRALLDATLVRLALASQFSAVADLLEDAAPADETSQKKNGEPAGRAAPVKAAPLMAAPQMSAAPRGAAAKPSSSSFGTPPAAPTPQAFAPSPQRTDFAAGSNAPRPAIAPPPAPPSLDLGEDDDLPRPGKVWEADGGADLSELLKQRMATDSASVTTPIVESGLRLPDAPSPTSRPHESLPQASLPHASLPQAGDVPDVRPSDPTAIWELALKHLEPHGTLFLSVLRSARFGGIAEDQAVIRFNPDQETFARQWQRNGKRDQVRDALSQAAGRNIGVRFEIASEPSPGDENTAAKPARAAAQSAAARPSPASAAATPAPPPVQHVVKPTADQLAEISRDPLVASLMDVFGAVVLRISDYQR